jgi:hypothetical protein
MENLGIFYDHLVYFRPSERCYGHLVYFAVIWYISPRFGNLYQEKSGNAACYIHKPRGPEKLELILAFLLRHLSVCLNVCTHY